MFHLVIARGRRCEYCKIIKSDNYEELSKYTTKFYNSNEIRNNNKRVVNSFYNVYGTQGDIVIMDDELKNQRFRVLYKNDIKIVKELVKSQNFMKYLVSHNLLIVSEYDYKAIMYYKNKDYMKHINDFLKRQKSYYNTVRILLKNYEMYQRKHKELPSIYSMKKEFDTSNKDKEELSLCNQLESYELNSNVKNEDFYGYVSSSYSYGGYEEVFNDCSIDDLVYYDDFKKLVKSSY